MLFIYQKQRVLQVKRVFSLFDYEQQERPIGVGGTLNLRFLLPQNILHLLDGYLYS